MQEITVYTTVVCGYCSAAKRLLGQRGLAYKEVDLTSQPELRQRLSTENNGYRTVPMIFVGAKFIGGYTELVDLDRSGELKSLVEA